MGADTLLFHKLSLIFQAAVNACGCPQIIILPTWIVHIVFETVARSLPGIPALRDTRTSVYSAGMRAPSLQGHIHGESQTQYAQSIRLVVCFKLYETSAMDQTPIRRLYNNVSGDQA
jgi:hypothetical protein